jgi:deazaflavin-dependent oxidoreductase (nitroreductase family)
MSESLTHDFENMPRWNWKPPRWMNRTMMILLRTPVLHRLVSGAMVLITFTGRKSGKQYRTPVSYVQVGDQVIVLTKRFRKWWHNFEEECDVTLHLQGKSVTGRAQAYCDDEAAPLIAAMFKQSPVQAKYYRITLGPENEMPPEQLQAFAAKIVAIAITLDSTSA